MAQNLQDNKGNNDVTRVRHQARRSGIVISKKVITPFLRKFDSKIQDAAREATGAVFADQPELVRTRLRLPARLGGGMIQSMHGRRRPGSLRRLSS